MKLDETNLDAEAGTLASQIEEIDSTAFESNFEILFALDKMTSIARKTAAVTS